MKGKFIRSKAVLFSALACQMLILSIEEMEEIGGVPFSDKLPEVPVDEPEEIIALANEYRAKQIAYKTIKETTPQLMKALEVFMSGDLPSPIAAEQLDDLTRELMAYRNLVFILGRLPEHEVNDYVQRQRYLLEKRMKLDTEKLKELSYNGTLRL